MITTPHTRPFTYPIIQEYAAIGLDPTKIELLCLFDPAGNLYDASGNQRHGVLEGGAIYTGGGRYGTAGFTDGVDDDFRITSFDGTGNTRSELSVSIWIKVPNQALNTLISQYDIGTANSIWSIRTISDFTVLLNGGAKVFKTTTNPKGKGFNMFTFTFDGNIKSEETPANDGNLRLYYNDVDETSATVDNNLTQFDVPATDIIIGGQLLNNVLNDPGTQYIDSMLIYSGVLNQSQISNKFNAGL
jgi:hypothetical protein